MLIGDSTAEKIKLEIGNAWPQDRVVQMEVFGRHLAEGVPKMITISSSEVLEALREPLAGIVSAVKQALEQTPPELSADVAELGIVLTGGGALLRDMDRLLSEETGLHVQVAEDPLTCVARGGGRALELLDTHGNVFFAYDCSRDSGVGLGDSQKRVRFPILSRRISVERRVGKEFVSTCRSRWLSYP